MKANRWDFLFTLDLVVTIVITEINIIYTRSYFEQVF